MKKEKVNKELDRLIDELTGKQILRHTCQLLVGGDKEKLKPLGSGVFVIIHGIHFLLTASHVVDDWSDENQIFVRIGHKEHVSLVGELRCTDLKKGDKLDIAYIKIDKRIISDLEKPYLFLPISKIRDHIKMLDAAQYCVMGYPEKSKQEYNEKIEPCAQAFYIDPCKYKVYVHYQFHPNQFHLMEMKGKGVNIKTGSKKKIDTHFYGMSGCGLWQLIIYQNQGKYSLDYRLIGIMSEFRKAKYFCMIGVKIKFIMEDLEVLEKMKFTRVNLHLSK